MVSGKKKTGIMGGTFNPIHIGHLLLAENAKETFGLDEILFIPSGFSYMKSEMEVAPKNMRLEMTRLAIADNPSFLLSPIEVEREGNSYTCDTLVLLRREEPAADFYFIAGADSLFAMENWKQPEKIFHHCTVLASVREGSSNSELMDKISYLEDKFHADIRFIDMKEIAVSSTDIRDRIRMGKSIRYMVPDKVIAYIEEHHLYQ